jgi:signal transduction histidine kinase
MMRLSGLLIWLVLGLPAIDPSTRSAQEIPRFWTGWITCYLTFGIAYYFGSAKRPITPTLRINAIALQSLCVLGMILSFQNYFTGFLMVLVAWQLGFYFPVRVAFIWAALQTFAAVVALEPHWHMGWRWAVTSSVVGLEAFAIVAGKLLAKEAAAHDELLLLNVELTSTRELLKESSRVEERLHIARELHDVLGHHLAALSIQLEHAVHVAPDSVRSDIEGAQASTRQMLGDIRSVVSTMRASEQIDLTPILNSLIKRVLRPKISLEIPSRLALADGVRAHAVLRCVQEIITNTVKHSGAHNLWITVAFVDGAIEVSARDDGHGLAPARPGAGLTGMKERFESLGGRVEFNSQPDAGFVLRAQLPARPKDQFA